MTDLLKIVITSDPLIPVPPLLYGGIERIIDMLIRGLLEKGHHVSLFAHPDSRSEAKLYPYSGKTFNLIDSIRNSWQINKVLTKENFDVVHCFARLGYVLPQLPLSTPVLMSYQREPTVSQIKRAATLSRPNTLCFTGCSNYITSQIKPFAPAYTIYNGVDLNIYNFSPDVESEAPLGFLGRLEPIKGAHIAIQVAQSTNRKLIIAGNIVPGYEDYFNSEIRPFLNDDISYIGAVNDQDKNFFLGQCSALLMPISWDEPFGIVMIEAMACGTPVLAFRRGSVPEVVIHGTTGFVCDTVDEMIEHVPRISNLNRATVRDNVSRRFSAELIVDEYLSLYERLMAGKIEI